MKYDTPRHRAKTAGLKRYEGLPCINCGGKDRYVSNQACVPCRQAKKYAARKKKQIYDKRGRPPKEKVELTPEQQLIKQTEKRAREREYWQRPENLGRKRAKKAKRRTVELQRKPEWITKEDLWLIKEIYDIAAERTQLFGFRWEVDHIIPLQGKTASGLHVPSNLQVIPMADNRKKQNKYSPL